MLLASYDIGGEHLLGGKDHATFPNAKGDIGAIRIDGTMNRSAAAGIAPGMAGGWAYAAGASCPWDRSAPAAFAGLVV